MRNGNPALPDYRVGLSLVIGKEKQSEKPRTWLRAVPGESNEVFIGCHRRIELMTPDNNDTPIESLDAWLSRMPFWEQYVWKINLEKDALTDEDIDRCYQYLSEHLGLLNRSSHETAPIRFKNEITIVPEPRVAASRIRMLEVKEFSDVNAISAGCSIKLGSHLTLIYGANASGKSGVGRLLCNACFSRGEREILPNVKTPELSDPKAKATFVIDDGFDEPKEINYSLGDNIDELKRFSIFDSKSILIHLDQSNQVSFTPAQIRIFDKVADTISRLEEKLNNERNARKKDNPFQGMFLDDATSATAIFCKGISDVSDEGEFLQHANFDAQTHGSKMVELEKTINEKRALDIPKKKSQLAAECQNLGALKATLQSVLNHFASARVAEVNRLVADILEKKRIAEAVSVKNFDDGLLSTIGSAEWKALISAGKALYEREKIVKEGNEPTHCLLCHQALTVDASLLLQKYWEFLDSKAESELSRLTREQQTVLQDLQSAKAVYPRFLTTDPGVRILNEEDPVYLAELSARFDELEDDLDDAISRVDRLLEVNDNGLPLLDIERIDRLITRKKTDASNLVDPTSEIVTLTAQLNSFKHKKAATAVRDAGLEYMSFLKWSAKAAGVNFAGIKMATTKKRTESFLVGVGEHYKGVFNQELAQVGCDFDLVMFTSGDQGNTVKEYRLDFAEDHNPSQILSEGEQNACALADFLTEVQLDKNNCGIIFDDPVTSLDHERKDKIAQRLVLEAARRQVVIFTHDIVFMSQLVKHADKNKIPTVAHWMRKVNGVPGYVEENASPKLTSVARLKEDSAEAVKEYHSLGAKEQERGLGAAFDYLRSACEALIEEVLFAGTIQRYNDQIKVQNLEEVVFDQAAALKIVDLHGRVSEVILAHNRSDQQRENSPSLADLVVFRKEFDLLEQELRQSLKAARKDRQARKDASLTQQLGW